MAITDSALRPRFFIPSTMLGAYNDVSLSIYSRTTGLQITGSPHEATQVAEVPGVYATGAFTIPDEGDYVFIWELDGEKVAFNRTVKDDADGDLLPGQHEFLYEAPLRETGLTTIVMDVYDVMDDYSLHSEAVPCVEEDHLTGVYESDPVSLPEGVYLLHWRSTGAEHVYQDATVVRVYRSATKYQAAIEVLLNSTATKDVEVLLLDADGDAYELKRTDRHGKVVFEVGRGSYTTVFRHGSYVFAENNVALSVVTGDVVVSKDIATIAAPASTTSLGSDDLVTLSWTSYDLSGAPSRAKYVIESLADSVGTTIVAKETKVLEPNEAGEVSVTVPKNIRVRIYPPGGAPRTLTASEDGNPFSGYAGAVASTMAPTSALPTLTKTT